MLRQSVEGMGSLGDAPLILPTVDITAFWNRGHEVDSAALHTEKEAAVRSLDAACSRYGMFLLTAKDDAVSSTTSPAFCAAEQLFRLPDDVKRRAVPENPSPAAARGYLGLGAESGSGLLENKECFSFGPDFSRSVPSSLNALQAKNVWPAGFNREKTEPFYTYLAAMTDIASSLGRAIAAALQSNDIMNETDEGKDISFVRMFHYFPGKDGLSTGSSAHTDWGMFSIVAQEWNSLPALQLFVDGQWRCIAPAENAVVVNIGDYLQLMTNRRWKSPLHRVISTSRERTSLCYFHYPAFDTPVPRLDDTAIAKVAEQQDICLSFVQDQSAKSGNTASASHLALSTMGLAIAEKWSQVSRGSNV